MVVVPRLQWTIVVLTNPSSFITDMIAVMRVEKAGNVEKTYLTR